MSGWASMTKPRESGDTRGFESPIRFGLEAGAIGGGVRRLDGLDLNHR